MFFCANVQFNFGGLFMTKLLNSIQTDQIMDARLYEVDPDGLASGCPINSKQGIIPRAKKFFASIFLSI